MNDDRRKGLVLVVLSAVFYSTPGLFTRGVSAGGWEVVFWRGVYGAIFTLAYLAWRRRLGSEFSQLDQVAWLAAAIWASGAAAYLIAYKLTSIANVSLIYGSAPILSALLGWIFLKETPRRIVLGASLVALAGVAVIAAGSLGSLNVLGDALAFWMTFTVAAMFVIYRKHPRIPTGSVTILSCLLAMPAALIWGAPFDVSQRDMVVLVIFGAVFVLASILLNEGSKLLPPAETALLSILEVPLQPVLAWAIFLLGISGCGHVRGRGAHPDCNPGVDTATSEKGLNPTLIAFTEAQPMSFVATAEVWECGRHLRQLKPLVAAAKSAYMEITNSLTI